MHYSIDNNHRNEPTSKVQDCGSYVRIRGVRECECECCIQAEHRAAWKAKLLEIGLWYCTIDIIRTNTSNIRALAFTFHRRFVPFNE